MNPASALLPSGKCERFAKVTMMKNEKFKPKIYHFQHFINHWRTTIYSMLVEVTVTSASTSIRVYQQCNISMIHPAYMTD
jgi:hypothetical protein